MVHSISWKRVPGWIHTPTAIAILIWADFAALSETVIVPIVD